jgi:hypothetical protein
MSKFSTAQVAQLDTIARHNSLEDTVKYAIRTWPEAFGLTAEKHRLDTAEAVCRAVYAHFPEGQIPESIPVGAWVESLLELVERNKR